MSADASRVKQRKNIFKGKGAKSKNNDENGVTNDIVTNGKSSAVKPILGSSKTSFLVKSSFYTLLSIFVVVATLVSIDYRTGHLRKAYETNIPPEIRHHLDNGASIAVEKFNVVYAHYDYQYQEVKALTRSWVKDLDVGGINLEELLFAEEIEQERIDIARKAAEKIKQAVDAINKKVAQDKNLKHPQELKVDQEGLKTDTEKGDEELKNKLELEKQKIEEEAKILMKKNELEEKKRKQEAEELKKRQELENQKKLQEEADKLKREQELEQQKRIKKQADDAKKEADRLAKEKEQMLKLEKEKELKKDLEKQRLEKDIAAEAKRKMQVEAKRKQVQDSENEKLEIQRLQTLNQALESLEKKHTELEMAAKDEVERQRLKILHKAARDQFAKEIEKAKNPIKKTTEKVMPKK